MFCTKCGKNNPDGVAFCTACGTPMEEGVNPVHTPAEIKKPKKKKKHLKAVIIIAVILAILAGIVAAAFWAFGANITVKSAVEKIETGLKKEDSEEILYAFMPKAAKYIIIEEYFDGDKDDFEDALNEADDKIERALAEEGIDIISVELSGKLKDADEETEQQIKNEMGGLYGIPVNEVKSGKIKITYREYGEKKKEKINCYFYKTILGWAVYYPDWQYIGDIVNDIDAYNY